MNSKSSKIIFASLLSLPVLLYAQTVGQNVTNTFNTLDQLIKVLTSGVVQSTGYLLMGVATVTFIIGIIRFLWAGKTGDVKKLEDGRRFLLWGLIGMFVLFSMYGIIKFAQYTLGVTNNSAIDLPNLNLRPNQTGSFTGMASGNASLAQTEGDLARIQAGAGGSGSGSGQSVVIGGQAVCDQTKLGQSCPNNAGTCTFGVAERAFACIVGLPAGTQSIPSIRQYAYNQITGGATYSGNICIRVGNGNICLKGSTTQREIEQALGIGQTPIQTGSGAQSGGGQTSGGTQSQPSASSETSFWSSLTGQNSQCFFDWQCSGVGNVCLSNRCVYDPQVDASRSSGSSSGGYDGTEFYDNSGTVQTEFERTNSAYIEQLQKGNQDANSNYPAPADTKYTPSDTSASAGNKINTATSDTTYDPCFDVDCG